MAHGSTVVSIGQTWKAIISGTQIESLLELYSQAIQVLGEVHITDASHA